MEKITKNNIQSVIEKILKEYKVSWQIDISGEDNVLYELNISSNIDSFIQIELVDDVNISLYASSKNSKRIFLYEEDFESNDVSINLEDQIENLIENVKNINKVFSKIYKKIEDIKNICEENGLDYEDFIEVLVDIE